MSRRAGFTLLEICLAVAIGLMLVMLSVPSIRGILQQRRLQRVEGQFDDLVRRAQNRSVNERRTYGLVWTEDALKLVPEDRTDDAPPGELESLPIGKDQEYFIDRTAAMGKNPPPVWTFWRSGSCEPVTVSYRGPEGKWTAVYDPLTSQRLDITETYD